MDVIIDMHGAMTSNYFTINKDISIEFSSLCSLNLITGSAPGAVDYDKSFMKFGKGNLIPDVSFQYEKGRYMGIFLRNKIEAGSFLVLSELFLDGGEQRLSLIINELSKKGSVSRIFVSSCLSLKNSITDICPFYGNFEEIKKLTVAHMIPTEIIKGTGEDLYIHGVPTSETEMGIIFAYINKNDNPKSFEYMLNLVKEGKLQNEDYYIMLYIKDSDQAFIKKPTNNNEELYQLRIKNIFMDDKRISPFKEILSWEDQEKTMKEKVLGDPNLIFIMNTQLQEETEEHTEKYIEAVKGKKPESRIVSMTMKSGDLSEQYKDMFKFLEQINVFDISKQILENIKNLRKSKAGCSNLKHNNFTIFERILSDVVKKGEEKKLEITEVTNLTCMFYFFNQIFLGNEEFNEENYNKFINYFKWNPAVFNSIKILYECYKGIKTSKTLDIATRDAILLLFGFGIWKIKSTTTTK